MQHPIVISYYTPDTAYETHAEKLTASLRRLGLEYRIEGRPARSSWVENCAQKALFISQMRAELGAPVLWVDADAIMLRPLSEVAGSNVDIAAVRRDGWSFFGGQVYFGVGDAADQLVERWCRYCVEFPHVWDQVSLGYAWWDVSLETKLTSLWLGENTFQKASRNRAFRLVQRMTTGAATMHKQESRRSAKLQKAYKTKQFATSDLPEWWREACAQGRIFPITDSQRGELGLTPTA
ncbi:conserved hypothetical protein [Aurantimonas manganoxydans SI85-9A1]|uniref:Nucleotide-diphospho-sugar transferase domain-containing protein n=1 Tax=Aurantimonas manganoxydans (strain ATCC BAA-1229 / DSM 21871 / SI85-9A1) TaxID=287752 RepID=Q1YNC9_AURMS|nr:hypothetical protein [Aurantimonas manganoxydans]EAS51102.1 conserved hypothetical protein [Aurantimonas manganoxydans SI85-9A1]